MSEGTYEEFKVTLLICTNPKRSRSRKQFFLVSVGFCLGRSSRGVGFDRDGVAEIWFRDLLCESGIGPSHS